MTKPQPLDLAPIQARCDAHARQDIPALIAEVLRLRELLDQRTADIADKALENAALRAQVDAVRVWVVNTIHGSAAAEVGPLIGQRPPRIEYCPRCKRPHLDCTC